MTFNIAKIYPNYPKTWQVVKVKDVARINQENIQKNLSPDTIIQYIDISSVDEGRLNKKKYLILKNAPSRAKRIVTNNDIIISMVRPNLKHYLYLDEVAENTIASTGFVTISPRKINPRYLFYQLTSEIFTKYLTQIAETHAGAYPSFIPDVIEEALIFLPLKKVQDKIADVLGNIDEKIDILFEINKIMERMLKSIYKDWFIDFNPFLNDIENKNSRIPNNWENYFLDDIVELYPKRTLLKGKNYSKVMMKEIVPNQAQIIKANKEPYKGSGAKYKNGDILLARITPCLEHGKTILVDFLEEGEFGFGSTEYIVMHPKAPIGSSFVYCLSKFEPFRQYAISLMTGTSGRQRVQHEGLKTWKVTLPLEISFIKKFEEIGSAYFKLMRTNLNEVFFLTNIRKLLLPRLISGNLEITD